MTGAVTAATGCPAWCERHQGGRWPAHQSRILGQIGVGQQHTVLVTVLADPSGPVRPEVAVVSTKVPLPGLLLCRHDAAELAALLDQIGSTELAGHLRAAVTLLTASSGDGEARS